MLNMLVRKNKRAVLLADGHKSRYDIEIFDMLRDADIDLLIIPAHTSHILQPLDLRLNGLIKEEFNKAWVAEIPKALLATVTLKLKKNEKTRRSNRAGPRAQPEAQPESQSESQSDAHSADQPEAQPEAQSGTQELEFVKAEYDRVHLVSCIRDAIPKALSPGNILFAWETAHLYPFQKEPNYSKEKEEENLKELRQSSIHAKPSDIQLTDGVMTGLVNNPDLHSATGVINSPARLPSVRWLLSHEIVTEENNDTADVCVSAEPMTLFLLPPQFDAIHIGDYFRIIPGSDGEPDRLLPVSDAPLFFNYDPKDVSDVST